MGSGEGGRISGIVRWRLAVGLGGEVEVGLGDSGCDDITES